MVEDVDKIYVISFHTIVNRFVFAERFLYSRTMKRNILFCFFIFYACNQAEKKNTVPDLQKLSSVLPTANWRVTDGTGTSYIYFSPQFDNTYKTYEYKLVHGDSSVTNRGSIQSSGNSVVWNWNNHSLWLEEITDSKASWKEKNSNENYVLQKINDSFLQLRSSGHQWMLKKTLPLSTFLVRARYDYEQGTKFLDSTEIPPGKLISQ